MLSIIDECARQVLAQPKQPIYTIKPVQPR